MQTGIKTQRYRFQNPPPLESLKNPLKNRSKIVVFRSNPARKELVQKYEKQFEKKFNSIWECKNSSYICAQILQSRRGLNRNPVNSVTHEKNISAIQKKTQEQTRIP